MNQGCIDHLVKQNLKNGQIHEEITQLCFHLYFFSVCEDSVICNPL